MNMRPRGAMRMLTRAVKEGWPVSESQRAEAVELVDAVLSNPHSTAREILGAGRLITAMEKANLSTRPSPESASDAAETLR